MQHVDVDEAHDLDWRKIQSRSVHNRKKGAMSPCYCQQSSRCRGVHSVVRREGSGARVDAEERAALPQVQLQRSSPRSRCVASGVHAFFKSYQSIASSIL
ncbi:hypothetical protein C8Q80DRAFT_1141632 [Daedaleopsis nitida]|nr:hypothetical protein C8Q80DRAFT_1141632 [Daedaleopsis nitida]